MFDLVSFINQRSYEAEFAEATDSVRTQIVAEKDSVVVRKLYDVEPALKRAEFFRKFNRECNGFSRNREFRHVGCMPTHIALAIIKKAGGDPLEESRLIKRYYKEHPEFSTVDSVSGI